MWAWSSSLSFSSRISMASVPKKTEIELELLTDIDTLSIAKKVLEVEYVMQSINMQQKTINAWEAITKTNNHHFLRIKINNLYG